LDGSGWGLSAQEEQQAEADCAYLYFYIILQISTRVWRRQRVLYTGYPWKLTRLADTRLEEADVREIVGDFLAASQCCLDEGFGLRLRNMFSDVNDCSGLREICDLLSVQKPLNAEIEDNFARHHSCSKAARGSCAWFLTTFPFLG
jgi:hypothetical protein